MASAFLKKFDGGDCFLVKPLAGAAQAYLGVGAQVASFRRFVETYKREIGVDPQLSLRPITSPECPVVEIMRPAVDEAAAPRIELADPHVGRNKPLTGTIADVRDRRLYLLLVDNEGAACRLDPKIKPGKNVASFSVRLNATDANSFGVIQLILAIISDSPGPRDVPHWRGENHCGSACRSGAEWIGGCRRQFLRYRQLNSARGLRLMPAVCCNFTTS
jgi:serine/threonine-protein kinase